jgi:uncharacterized protein (DUF433 family)
MGAIFMAMQPDLTIRETAALAGASMAMVENALEKGVLRAIVRSPDRRGGAGRYLPMQAVAYFAVIRRAELSDLPVRHKKCIWQVLAHRKLGELAGLIDLEYMPGLKIDVRRLAGESLDHAVRYKRAKEEHIVVDPEILGGTPVIRGTRLTVYAVHARLAAGESVDDVVEDYPQLTREAIEAADVYARTHPLRGRPSGRPWRAAARN